MTTTTTKTPGRPARHDYATLAPQIQARLDAGESARTIGEGLGLSYAGVMKMMRTHGIVSVRQKINQLGLAALLDGKRL